METNQLFQLRPIDWRWIIVSYCFLVLFHLFPSFLLTGWTHSLMEPFGFLIWLALGTAIICAIIGFKSRGITILEPGLASILYAFTLFGTLKTQWFFGRSAFNLSGTLKNQWIFGPHNRSLVEQVLVLLAAFVIGCFGAAFGEWLQMRKEKKQVA